MSAKKIKSTKNQPTRLRDQIEQTTTPNPDSPLFDVEDEDVLGYVDQFLRAYSRMPLLEKTSLMSKEEALKALVVLEKAHTLVQSHLKTAQALKRLLNSRGEASGESH